jgi:chorismate synthase
VVILDGIPAGLTIDPDAITRDLRRRQGGYGRGRRMAIERDAAVVLAGVRHGVTLGSPISLLIPNRDWVNWAFTMHPDAAPPEDAGGARREPVTRPRPGHADLAGGLKYGHADLRNVLERASARETAARVAAGAVARQLLALLGIRLGSHVFAIGGTRLETPHAVPFDVIAALPETSATRCIDAATEARMIADIDRARAEGDTLGGAFEVVATGVPPGLGSYSQWDRRLDGRLAQALMSIPAIKAVGIGLGPVVADLPGSRVHDPIVMGGSSTATDTAGGLHRPTNHAGGLEGGITNGEDLRVSAYMKPIATLMKPLGSVDLATMTPAAAAIERSDVCAVPAAAVVGEAVVALVLADAALEKYGGDHAGDMKAAHAASVAAAWQRLTGKEGASDS